MNMDLIRGLIVLSIMLVWFFSPWPFWALVNNRKYDLAGFASLFVFLVSIFVGSRL